MTGGRPGVSTRKQTSASTRVRRVVMPPPVRDPAVVSSSLEMRSVPSIFQVARGALGPVSRGTSTDMSTNW